MDKDKRIELIDNSLATGEKKSLLYKGKNTLYDVKEIPLEALLYNIYNGRIRSWVLSREANFPILNPENESDKIIIQQYLYDSSKAKNEKTIESLEEKGQQEVGIITKDGVIIDGNRRALLLNRINAKNNTSIPFKAIVLPDELQNSEREILLLETSYQMGVDSKVEYNPIEKYLRCKELKDTHNFSANEIAKMMAESETQIIEWLNILKLMEEYLVRLKSPNVYTRLEKREGHFVDLNTYLKSYLNKQSYSVRWPYVASDVERMKHAYFDYIRLGIPVLRARNIGKANSSNSFFCQKDVWDEFITEHENIINSFTEKDFAELRSADPSKSNEDIVRDLDEVWKEHVESRLFDNISYSEIGLKEVVELHLPMKILKRVVNSLGQIDFENIDKTHKDELIKLLDSVKDRVEVLKDKIITL